MKRGLLASCLAAAVAACAGAEDGSSCDAGEGCTADPREVECAASATGKGSASSATAGSLLFEGAQTSVALRHRLELGASGAGCVGWAELETALPGTGCRLRLVFSSDDGGPLRVRTVKLETGGSCARFEGTQPYFLVGGRAELSVASGGPERTAPAACFDGALAMSGVMRLMAAGSATHEVDLSGVSIAGRFASSGQRLLVCPGGGP